eukprot:scaffold9345_cov120-Cylindrotheca_fusiformis.AAC.17
MGDSAGGRVVLISAEEMVKATVEVEVREAQTKFLGRKNPAENIHHREENQLVFGGSIIALGPVPLKLEFASTAFTIRYRGNLKLLTKGGSMPTIVCLAMLECYTVWLSCQGMKDENN